MAHSQPRCTLFTCKQCGYANYDAANMYKHVRTKRCQGAEVDKQAFYVLASTMDAQHGKPKCIKLTCKQCGYMNYDAGNMKKHARTKRCQGAEVDKQTFYVLAFTTDAQLAAAASTKIKKRAAEAPNQPARVKRTRGGGPKGGKCEAAECKRFACYGKAGQDTRPQRCGQHKQEGDVNMVSRRCAHPDCSMFVNREKFCAAHDTEQPRYTRVRENQVANFLREAGLHWTSWNKQLAETACGRYRPDFAFQLPTHLVIVEVDEHQHAQPGYSCDNARMLDVFAAYGGLPVHFLRFNPDAFKLGGTTQRQAMKTRLKVLEAELRAALAQPPTHLLTITRLFYDSPDKRAVSTTWVSPDDPAFTEHRL